MMCREAILTTRHSTSIVATTLKCKRWSCDYCRPINKRRVVKRARRGQPTTILTLTSNPNVESDPDRAAELLKKAFTSLIKKLRRRYPSTKIEYMAVFERTQRGMPHLHVLMRAPYIPQRLISAHMKRHTGAPIVDIRAVRGQRQVAQYVSKYIGKDPTAFAGRQRHWHSRGYLIEEPLGEDELPLEAKYTVANISINWYANYLRNHRYRIEWDHWNDGFIAIPP